MSQAEHVRSQELRRIGLWLEPLDVLFFRDGRPFAAASRVRSGQPMPQTLAGAIWTALLRQAGCDFSALKSRYRAKIDRSTWEENLPENEIRERTKQAWQEAIREAGGPEWIFQLQVRGPWLARIRDVHTGPAGSPKPANAEATNFDYPVLAGPQGNRRLEIFLPMPAVLYQPKGKKADSANGGLRYAKPLAASRADQLGSAWKTPREGLRPVWIACREDMELASGYLRLAGLARFMRGQPPQSHDCVEESELFDYDHRTGIGIEMDRLTSEETQIYAISLLALQKAVGFYAEVLVPPAGAETLKQVRCLQWGGESRNVRVEPTAVPCRWPLAEPTNGQKPFLLLTTPGFFAEGWLPGCLKGVLAAAAVPGETAVSGWDLARGGPKPARFAAAAGSVYFLEKTPDQLPEVLSDLEEDRQHGWGCYLQGVWTDD